MIDVFFRNFTLLAFGFSLLNMWAVRRKTSRAAKLYLASFSMLFLVWWLLQVAGGYSTFFFILLPPDENPLVALFWLVLFLTVWGEAFWMIWGNGADELLKNKLVYGDERFINTRNVKLFYGLAGVLVPLLVVFGYISGFFAKASADLGRIF